MELIKITSAEWAPQFLLIVGGITILFGIFLGLTKRVIFYNDYNDLGVSLATLGIPACMALGFTQFGLLTKWTGSLIAAVFFLLFTFVLFKTWQANDRKILTTFVVGISKLVLSLLYVVYLAQLTMGKQRQKRGIGLFILAFLTPLLLALVHCTEGSFRLTLRGRPTFRQGRNPENSPQPADPPENIIKNYKCPHCDIIAKSEHGLRRHVIAKHGTS